MKNNNLEEFKELQNHLKATGFIFPGSQIYNGLANTYDYGPLGILLINNLKKMWWTEFITKEINNHGLDSKILMNSQVWKASGHLANFSDPLIENKVNGKRYRADHVIANFDATIEVEKMNTKEMETFIVNNIKKYDNSKTDWTKIRNFQLMFQTKQGVTDDSLATVYLRPETAQGIFVNFKNIQRAMRLKLPFGVGQIGKAFRNEVTPGNFIFRTREFEQMELEYFVKSEDALKSFAYYLNKAEEFMAYLGLKTENLRAHEHQKDELAHYAQKASDLEFKFPFGWGELMGIHHRGDYDLKAHMEHAKEDLTYHDPTTNKRFLPNVIESSVGTDRLALALLCDAFTKEKVTDQERIVLKLKPQLAPYQVAILPLVKKHHQAVAYDLFQKLAAKGLRVTYDDAGSIGKRYRRQDAIGTPLILTVIDQSATTKEVTIRFRDSMKQEHIKISDLPKYLGL